MMNRICIVDCKIINKLVRIFKIFFGLWVLKVVVIILNIVKVNIFVKDRNNRWSFIENFYEMCLNFMFFILFVINIMEVVINRNMVVLDIWIKIMVVFDIGCSVISI